MNNCDEFFYYDDFIRQDERSKKRRKKAAKKKTTKSTGAGSKKTDDNMQEGIDLVLETAEALEAERGDREKLWGSMVKQALKRLKPGFNEGYYGFESFGKLLEEAKSRGQIDLELDEKSGGYILRTKRQ